MAPPPRELASDAISEILLRLPPDEPECLFRAALVCKTWLCTITDPAFLRCYRAFHGTPPLLGYIGRDKEVKRGWSFRLFPTRAVPALPFPAPDTSCEMTLDCRHGRLLIGCFGRLPSLMYYLVRDPVTGARYRLPQLEIMYNYRAAAGCKHLDCHGGPFCVVLIFKKDGSTATMSATFYSSEVGTWSEAAMLQGIDDRYLYGRGAVIGDEIYFMLSGNTRIIKYGLGENSLSLINLPPSAVYKDPVTLMVTEDCSLGLASVEHSRLYLWSRRMSSEEIAEWAQCRAIDLDTVMPMANLSDGASAVGFAEGVDVIFVRTLVELFMVELKSGRVRKFHEPNPDLNVLPYMAFYTPDRSILSP